ncbi:4-(cytidine 5'-diphospho)-2-C-methyl-D-erythritol kinase [Parasphaerochaeta coccoides]|uniref:4-diphosphocytidyl-2-C-methyl-D-erythritol kinase n=1 Tax=Parasphaerochaeta coccoides (strain ATCC BAA-1237 / DSM 17374 / SPN1) TaxID=760011 RepID=F4GJD5_PARC1|nr:4-diphosphocytidyl-2C-methyl-D-erythritol kinase [Parasphaerochaeta coccoides]AEC02200.1 4-diphosphocytidyl-2-C-methyl-D-erythritolkinase [Parasphaerochaeta coccoides DSM 17374]
MESRAGRLDSRLISCYRAFMTAIHPSYAKVNLHLEVGAKGFDGYHDISTVFHLVSLHDDVSVELRLSDKFSCSVTGLESICRPGEDSLHRAAEAWCHATGRPLSLDIRVTKRIPSGAGLGGGSSNAATLLSILDAAAPGGYSMGRKRLMELGTTLGSDVPFFLSGYTAAIGEGRGERLTPLKAVRDAHALIVMPPFSVSTPHAYLSLDTLRGGDSVSLHRFSFMAGDSSRLSSLLEDDVTKWMFSNDFRLTCGHEDVYDALEALGRKVPGVFSSLTGSGAAWVFISRKLLSLKDIQTQISRLFGVRFVMFSAILLFS